MVFARARIEQRWSRRGFLALVVGGVASTAIYGGVADTAPRRRRTAVRWFDVHHDPSVAVSMTNGRRFVVRVKDATTGAEIERHERVTGRNLSALRSDHFRIVERVEF